MSSTIEFTMDRRILGRELEAVLAPPLVVAHHGDSGFVDSGIQFLGLLDPKLTAQVLASQSSA
ncbi:hypothetical protein [Granulicoccus sp. GXG6511]|uniref:hypothetical protein n=1 Tax=Granulicoccus sp. GXG6511 TaxID=3381351 RepID=UPI003D7EFE9C